MEQRAKVKTSVNEIDAKPALAIPKPNAADPKGAYVRRSCAQGVRGGLRYADRNREIGVLGSSRNAPSLQSQSTDKRELGALLLQCRRCSHDRGLRIEWLDLADDAFWWRGSAISRPIRISHGSTLSAVQAGVKQNTFIAVILAHREEVRGVLPLVRPLFESDCPEVRTSA